MVRPMLGGRRWPFFFVAALSDATIFAQLTWKRHIGILNNQTAILSCWIIVALITAIWIASLWRKQRLPRKANFQFQQGYWLWG